MDNLYKLFNLNWNSKNLIFPELKELKIKKKIKDPIIIKERFSDLDNSIKDLKFSNPFLKIGKNYINIKIPDICTFQITNGKLIEWKKFDNNINSQDIRTFCLGSPIGALLIQRGYLLIHANALEKDGKAILCIGRSGVGKSTIAYQLLKQGWNLISDDIVALTSEGKVYPGIPRIKLWKDALNHFEINSSKLIPIRDKLYKYIIPIESPRIIKKTVPLKAIYFIVRDRFDKSKKVISPIESEKEAFLKLRNNTYRPLFVRALDKEGGNIHKLKKLLAQVFIANLHLPEEIPKMVKILKSNAL